MFGKKAKTAVKWNIEPPVFDRFFVRTAKVKQNLLLTNFFKANETSYLLVFQWFATLAPNP